MRGQVEESAEVKAARALREAARKFAGHYLVHGFGGPDVEAASLSLEAAAMTYAATQPRPRKRRPTKGPAR